MKRSKGPLTTREIDLQLTEMIRDNHSRSELDLSLNEIKEALNLKKNKQGLFEYHGRIIGDYPYLYQEKHCLLKKWLRGYITRR